MTTRKIDAYTHVIPAGLLESMRRRLPRLFSAPNMSGRIALYDIDARLRMMENFGEYRQILTLASPALEEWAPDDGLELARAANDGMAELVRQHPDHFSGFAAAVMLEDVGGSVRELHRAVGDLGALGVQIYTNVNGHPLDESRFDPFFAAAAELDITVWAHPTRGANVADYASEQESRYGINLKFGWPYETAVFMTRLIFSGVMDRYPGLRILTHHAGGFIPHLAGRLALQHETPEQRRAIGIDERYDEPAVIAAYRRFYGDIVFSGAHHPLRCALEFFGPDRLLFATDFPFGPAGGATFVHETIAAVEELADPALQRRLFQDNARLILRVPV